LSQVTEEVIFQKRGYSTMVCKVPQYGSFYLHRKALNTKYNFNSLQELIIKRQIL